MKYSMFSQTCFMSYRFFIRTLQKVNPFQIARNRIVLVLLYPAWCVFFMNWVLVICLFYFAYAGVPTNGWVLVIWRIHARTKSFENKLGTVRSTTEREEREGYSTRLAGEVERAQPPSLLEFCCLAGFDQTFFVTLSNLKIFGLFIFWDLPSGFLYFYLLQIWDSFNL